MSTLGRNFNCYIVLIKSPKHSITLIKDFPYPTPSGSVFLGTEPTAASQDHLGPCIC